MTDISVSNFLGFSLPGDDALALARNAALIEAASVAVVPTSLVSFESVGNVLIIGPEPYALSMAESLVPSLHCSILATERDRPSPDTSASPTAESGRTYPTAHATLEGLEGYLGQFSVTVRAGEKIVDLAEFFGLAKHFDIVLDLGRNPAIHRELLPPGYFAPGSDEESLHRALEEINGLEGNFEKPVYTIYNPDICAHGERGVTGCTNCLDACPANAILSIKELISVDPHLCHGAGVCATVCPSGAIAYAYPRSIDTLERLRRLLANWHEAMDSAPCLLFYDRESGVAQLSELSEELPGHVVPFPVESVGTIGLETYLYCLSHGAGSVVLLAQTAGKSAISVLQSQIGYAHALLAPFEMASRLLLLTETENPLVDSIPGPEPLPEFKPATFASLDNKRTVIKLALDHLCEYRSLQNQVLDLPDGAPFGEIRVNRDACTLCLACTAVCPMSALTDGVDLPQLNFLEWNCVQCGLCKTACPEDAISLAARYVFDPAARRSSRVLYEEQPFCCIVCNKPFASRGVIDKMLEKLGGHHMFQGEALNRLKMCEDCRVKDMF